MKIRSAEEMLWLGQIVGQKLKLPAVIELVGDVGVGKTTFTRGLAKGLAADQEVTSPSFTISKRYALPQGGELVHYDFYRLNDPGIMRSELAEVLALPRAVVVVEWGDDVTALLPERKIRIDIRLNSDGTRNVTAQGISTELWKTCGKLVEKCEINVQKGCSGGGKLPELPLEAVEKSKKSSYFTELGVVNLDNKRTQKKQELKLYLDTSTDTCILRLNDREYQRVGRYDLAEKILSFIQEKLQDQQADWPDITEITFFSGPGSFTGLRIGAAVVNTLADQLKIPLYDHHGIRRPIILPDYGREANISQPRK